MSKRQPHSPEFKAKVTMEAISGRETIQKIAADHAIDPPRVSQRKKNLWKLPVSCSLGARRARTKRMVRSGRQSCSSSTALQKPDGYGLLQIELE